jgi:peptidoglycan/xylan/chitin deacetylase (PgdA/CDA1 family)
MYPFVTITKKRDTLVKVTRIIQIFPPLGKPLTICRLDFYPLTADAIHTMKHVKVDLSIVNVISVLAIILIGLYSTSLRIVAFSEHEDDEDDEHNKFVILTFDDGYKSQYTNVNPILDKYGYKGTFYVVCNYAEKEDKDRMNWNEIQELQKQGHDIESHSMSHANLTDIPAYRVDIEIGVSKQCLVSQGFNVTIQ